MSETLRFCEQEDNFCMLQKVIQHMSPEQLFGSFIPRVEEHERKRDELGRWCYERTDKSEFRDPSYEGFYRCMMLMGPAMAMAVKAFYEGMPREEVKREFALKARLLRYGVCSERKAGSKTEPKSGSDASAESETEYEARSPGGINVSGDNKAGSENGTAANQNMNIA